MKPLKAKNYFPVEPWKQPLEQRLNKLDSHLASGYKVNVFLYEKPDSSTFRYRVYNMAQALESSARWRAAFFFADELDRIRDTVLRCQLVTIARFRWTFALETLITAARNQGIPIAFDTDDLVFDLAHVPALANVQNIDQRTETELNFWFSYVARVQLAAQLADMMITTNDYLGQFLQQQFQKPVHVIRNFLNHEQVDFSATCLLEKRQATDQKPFTIGYFSGSPSHYFDLHSIADELCDLLDDFPDIQILVAGYMSFAPRLQAYSDQGRIRFHKFIDFLTLQRLIAEVDVNIAPLYPNDFTQCKSELKFFEAALVETLTVATPTFAFKHAIQTGQNGYLCQQGQWYDTIKAIYLDREAQQPILAQARETALATYSPAANWQSIERVYEVITQTINKP